MSKPVAALGILLSLLALAVALIVVEVRNGAADYGTLQSTNPCTTSSDYPGTGLDPALQRIAINGLYGAACELGTTREELVLSFVPSVGQAEIEWDEETIERAVEAGLVGAIDEAEAAGSLPGIAATVLRELVQRAPIDWLIGRGGDLQELFGQLGDLGALFGLG